ncbi:aminotransferase class V-fold PLP-dependent enzyme, partial [Raoultella ornithinolytica]|uniref:aminotransferase class V-fold PLP-dependent enzyme n=1 Tax=Raoultella ornithinolytica TaxID=54291 RepID=UPI000E56F69A
HSLNLVANGLADSIEAGDEIVISVAEHHANFIPWQQLAERKQARLIVLPLNSDYQIAPETLQTALSERTKIVAFNLVSNVTGIRQPAEQLIPLIRQQCSAKIVLDVAQAVCCEQIDAQALDADFYAFSAHKMYGPTGVGVLTGKLSSL